MSSEGLGDMFEGDSADRCIGKFPLVFIGVRAECPACADTGARTPIGASGNFYFPLFGLLPPPQFFVWETHFLACDVLLCIANIATLGPILEFQPS